MIPGGYERARGTSSCPALARLLRAFCALTGCSPSFLDVVFRHSLVELVFPGVFRYFVSAAVACAARPLEFASSTYVARFV